LRDATFTAFDRLIELCLSEQVDFLLIAGDVFDSDIRSLSAQLHFLKGMQQLGEAGIDVYLVCGNHDPLNQWSSSLQLPANVHMFSGETVQRDVYTKDDGTSVDIFGMSYPQREVRQNLARQFRDCVPQSPLAIGLLHATVGHSTEHDNYAPCSKEDLTAAPVQYWALGHIHKRELMSESQPAIIYPGNPQGRDFGEMGHKGCYVVEWATGSQPQYTFKPLHAIRFAEKEIDISGIDELGGLYEYLQKNIPEKERPSTEQGVLLRLTLKGRTALHQELNRSGNVTDLLEQLNEGALTVTPFTWIDAINLTTTPAIDLAKRSEGDDFIGEVLREFDALEQDDDQLQELAQRLTDAINQQKYKDISQSSQEQLHNLLEQAKGIVLDQLLQNDEAE